MQAIVLAMYSSPFAEGVYLAGLHEDMALIRDLGVVSGGDRVSRVLKQTPDRVE